MAGNDCKNRLLLIYDLVYIGQQVPKNKQASAMFAYACKAANQFSVAVPFLLPNLITRYAWLAAQNAI